MHAPLSERFGKIKGPHEAKLTAHSLGSFSMGFPWTSNAFRCWAWSLPLCAHWSSAIFAMIAQIAAI